MKTSPEGALSALDKFIDAAERVNDEWHETLDEGYPACLPSFDEFVAQLVVWHMDARSAHNTHQSLGGTK